MRKEEQKTADQSADGSAVDTDVVQIAPDFPFDAVGDRAPFHRRTTSAMKAPISTRQGTTIVRTRNSRR